VKYSIHKAGLEAFGKQLRTLRRARKLSQEQLAWRADTELSQISRLERGIINTGLSQVFKIAEALEIPVKELFDFELPPIDSEK
jgi:transcriptional regulator with XRE-family HTH domain